MEFSHPKGTYDLIPTVNDSKDHWRSSHLWQYVEKIISECCRLYGLKEIRTPIFEKKQLFCRSVGQETDIVSKEMYEFKDKADREMVLRPEGTAAVMRAFLEEKLYTQGTLQKLYYIGPMFRYERPQAGRYRQHTQFGAEIIGSAQPQTDAEVIDLLYSLYTKLGLKNLKVNLNTVGNVEARSNFKIALKNYLEPYKNNLSTDSQVRLEKNPLRILDSKDPQDQHILEKAPQLYDFLSAECKKHFEEVQNCLKDLQIPFEISPKLVRGLDYYHRTVFEITTGDLGAQNSIAGGGRYDGLIKTLGGPDLPAVGFATGLERVVQTLVAQLSQLPTAVSPDLFIISLGDEARRVCFNLTKKLRAENISVEMDYSQKKVKDLFKLADQLKSRFIVVVGDDELANNQVTLKEMTSRSESTIPLDQIVSFLKKA